MTWYIWAFLSMVAGSMEIIIDKVIVIKKPEKIDVFVATFYRNLGFFVVTAILGLIGIFGKLSFVFNLPFLILAILWPLNSFGYDYLLRKVEVSRFNGIFFTFPLIFIFIDDVFFHTSYQGIQILGAFLLVIGAILFSLKTTSEKSPITLKGLFWIVIRIIPNVYLLVVYKMYSTSVNEVSFYFSVWLLLIAFYLLFIIFTSRYKKLKETAQADNFLVKTIVAKSFDSLCSIFYLEALAIASLTAVSAFTSFSPLVMLTMLLSISLFTKINTTEDFSKKTLILKIFATVILIAGGLCMFLRL